MNQPDTTPNDSSSQVPADAPPSSPLMARDAIGLLTEDHRRAQVLFADFLLLAGSQADPAEKFSVARQVCGDLLIHMAIEEAIFYPRVREALHDDQLVDEAEHEHDAAKELIRRIGEIDPADARFDESMQLLSAEILTHVEQEETVVFPKMLLAQVDLDAIGTELLQAKNQMRTNLGLQPE
jgi:iron-sulfur cluster repair protein YtfE (RIC family)